MNPDPPNEFEAEGVRDTPEDPTDSELHTNAVPQRRTLPPPEWLQRTGPRSASSAALQRYELDMPVPHRVGPRAELASLSARVAAASLSGEDERERIAASSLARALAARGTELELATRYARRALLLGEDPVLREELAGWFGSLGEPSLAAATLRPLLAGKRGTDAAALGLRLAMLLGRAGDAEGQRDALMQVAAESPTEAQALELLGAIGAWAPAVVPPAAAASAYLEAAERLDRLGERSSAFENLLRGYEMAPDFSPAAARLATALTLRGRMSAADEVRREHAQACADSSLHLERMRSAIKDGDLPRALGAAFDARLDAEVDSKSALAAIERKEIAPLSSAAGLDELLERTELHELFAARLAQACDSLPPLERPRALIALGKLYGQLGRPEHAVEVVIEALVSDPGNLEAKTFLRNHGSATRDQTPLVEAFVRIGQSGSGPEHGACLRELAILAEQRLADPCLASWAIDRLLEHEIDENLSATRARLAPRVAAQAEALTAVESELQGASGTERIELLSQVAALLQGRPDLAERASQVLHELCRLLPSERAHQTTLGRLLARQGRFPELEVELAELADLAEHAGAVNERARLLLTLANLRRRRGDSAGALAVLAPLVDASTVPAAVWSWSLLLAAQQADRALRARALLRLAAQLAPAFRATLSSVAAEELLATGDLALARLAADQACHADPSMARPVAARAHVALDTGDRWGAEAMERALGVLVPRAEFCRALARTYDTLGEPVLAMAFTQRLIALRPGDLSAARARLERVTEAGDGSRLADALAWVLSQPEPLEGLADALDTALRALAQLDPGRAGGLARRALDVIGPRVPALQSAVLAVADATGERGLGISTLERFLAAGSSGEARTERLLELARRRRASGDVDGSARALLRAVREGALASSVLAEIAEMPTTKSSDGELALLEARAEALSGSVDADPVDTALAWREVGAAYLDFAADAPHALRAWERAVALNPERGVECFAADLLAFVGPDDALRLLLEFADKREARDAARALAMASRMALQTGKGELAFRIASRALELDPTRADVLAVAERTASEAQIPDLEQLYERLSTAALGRFGERALHYRAARQFERRNDVERALLHAVRAFEAVPSQGVAWVAMARLVERSSRRADVVQAIERVALKQREPEARAAWLRRAAVFAGTSEDGKRQHVDLLLRALAVHAEVDLVHSLADALRDLLATVADDRDIVELRFKRALASLLPKLDGAEGARIAIACAVAALALFDAVPVALSALDRAVANSADLPGYSELFAFTARLAAAADAPLFVQKMLQLSAREFGGAGASLLELGARIAAALGERRAQVELLVAAAKQDPEQTDLVRRAEASARALGDPGLLDAVLDAVPPHERVAALLVIAEVADKHQDVERALNALGTARAIAGIEAATRRDLFVRTCDVLRRAGRRDDLELALEGELRSGDLAAGESLSVAAELAALIGARGEPERALELLGSLGAEGANDVTLLNDLVTLARQTGDKPRLAEALERLVELTRDPVARPALLREQADLLEQLGEDTRAAALWQEVLDLEPNDQSALAALERDAERRSDFERLVALLSLRATVASSVDEVRRIRLRRAVILEQRLGRADEARSELEALSVATGDNLSVLRVLADLNERVGAPLRAAPLWLRASAIAQDRSEAADLARKSCEAYLNGDDVVAARRVLDGMGAWAQSPRLLELAVEVERRLDDPQALSEALDELATGSIAPEEQRANWLVEAAHASISAGTPDVALAQATRAARIAPSSPPAQLLARQLEYLVHGPGDLADARITVAELTGIEGALDPEQAELRAFLLAEALDVAFGDGEGERVLEEAWLEVGERPLIAAGLAERKVEREQHGALRLFDVALAGDLRGLRSRGKLALRAAEAAVQVGNYERARAYLAIASSDAETREQAQVGLARYSQREQTATLLSLGESERESVLTERGLGTPLPARTLASSGALESAASEAINALSRTTSVDLRPVSERFQASNVEDSWAREVTRHSVRSPREGAADGPETTAPASPTYDKPTPANLAGQRPHVSGRYSMSPPAEEVVAPRAPSVKPEPRQQLQPIPTINLTGPALAPPHVSTLEAATPPSSSRQRDPQRQGSIGYFPASTVAESVLFQALDGGSLEAGIELVKELENRTSRTQDLVQICRRVALLAPGDTWAVSKLHEAALADRNLTYARAVEHVLAVITPGRTRVEPPPLADQVEQPDAVRTMLFRDSLGPVQEALAIVWEGAEHVFRRDASTYGVSGMERVSLTAQSPLARVYAGAARALALTRTPLFQRRIAGAITVNLALLSPPAVILSGDVRQETAELRFHLGAMLAAAIPQYALLFGSPESQARAVLHGLGFAFGPPRQTKSGGVLNLAEVLWESIPARFQRRLRELCDRPELLDYASALSLSRIALRRAGLFVAGDLGVALSEAAADDGVSREQLSMPNALAQLSRTAPSLRSLLTLALSPEYAETRWQFAGSKGPARF